MYGRLDNWGIHLNHTLIDRDSVVPLYYQIQRNLLDRINSGELKAGDPIPSEQEIAARLGVSRMTARQALKSLCGLGVAYSLRGKGTFVSGIKLEKNFRKVQSFTEEMRGMGHEPSSKVLEFKVISSPPDVTRALCLAPEDPVIHLRRLRLADAVPMGIEGSYLSHRLCADILDSFDPQTSLYDFLWRHYALRVTVADETIEAGVATAADARMLRIPHKSPVFVFTRVGYIRHHQPIEYVKSTYRADRYKIVNRLRRADFETSERSGSLMRGR
jgi:GntR family transcriptional regulator